MYYNDNEQQVTLCDISTLSCTTTIDGLQPHTLYNIEVSSSTAAGEGPRTNPIIVKTSIASEFINNEFIRGHHMYVLYSTSNIYCLQTISIGIAVVFGIVPRTITSFLPALTVQLQ